MSRPSGVQGALLTEFLTRTTAEIRRHLVKCGKRNPISRRYHAKDDEELIATWGLEFNRILRVFNVCSVVPVWRLPTFCFQAKPETNTMSGARQDAPNKHHPTVPDPRSNVANVHSASDIRRSELKSREGASGKNQAVSTPDTPPAIK